MELMSDAVEVALTVGCSVNSSAVKSDGVSVGSMVSS
jgi:hypothetical protein